MDDVTFLKTDATTPSAEAFMHVWTIYRHPSDFPPGTWVARRSEVHSEKQVLMTADIREAMSLDEVRAALPLGFTRIPRLPGEDPVIEEHWI